MSRRFILTPFFLDHFEGGLLPVAGACWDVNLPALSPGDPQARVASILRPLRNLVADTARHGSVPVSLAGDCLSAIGVAAGMQRAGASPSVVWFDAHGDFNTWETSPSGFLGGMPLAMLVGRGEPTIAESLGLTPIAEDLVLLSDGRDLDPEEANALRASRVTHVPSIERVASRLPPGPLHVHFDTDLIDPRDAPAMNYPARGGPSADEVRRVFRDLAATKRVVAISVSSWSPALDDVGRSRRLCMDLVGTLAADADSDGES